MFRIVNGKRILIGPKHGDKIHEFISLTLYGNQLKKLNQEAGKIKIAPNHKFSYNINISRLFDFSVDADYLISCKLNYFAHENNESQNTIEIKDIKIKVQN